MLTDFQRDKLTHLFKLYDYDGDEFLEREDFDQQGREYATHLGVALESPEGQQIIDHELKIWDLLQEHCDLNGDGQISREEHLNGFERMITSRVELDVLLEEFLDAVFGVIDLSNDGQLSEDEFVPVMFSDDEVQGGDVFRQLDTNGNGYLTRDEMLNHWQEFFFGTDPEDPSKWVFGKFE